MYSGYEFHGNVSFPEIELNIPGIYSIEYYYHFNCKTSSCLNSEESMTIYFDYENTSFSQFVELTDNNAVIGNLQMTINDRFGNIINNNGLDFSFSLAFLTD